MYSRSLVAFRTGASHDLKLSDVLRLGEAAAGALNGPDGVLENLSDADYAAVVAKMAGFVVRRIEVVWVEPDPNFFLKLARARGDRASVEFFDAYEQTVPGGMWSVYIQRQTDYSGCVSFGSLSLVATYRRWTAYRQRFHNRYTDEVANFIREVEEVLTRDTCACEGKEAVLREFGGFVHAFPSAPITPRVRERMKRVADGETDIRFNCISG